MSHTPGSVYPFPTRANTVPASNSTHPVEYAPTFMPPVQMSPLPSLPFSHQVATRSRAQSAAPTPLHVAPETQHLDRTGSRRRVASAAYYPLQAEYQPQTSAQASEGRELLDEQPVFSPPHGPRSPRYRPYPPPLSFQHTLREDVSNVAGLSEQSHNHHEASYRIPLSAPLPHGGYDTSIPWLGPVLGLEQQQLALTHQHRQHHAAYCESPHTAPLPNASYVTSSDHVHPIYHQTTPTSYDEHQELEAPGHYSHRCPRMYPSPPLTAPLPDTGFVTSPSPRPFNDHEAGLLCYEQQQACYIPPLSAPLPRRNHETALLNSRPGESAPENLLNALPQSQDNVTAPQGSGSATCPQGTSGSPQPESSAQVGIPPSDGGPSNEDNSTAPIPSHASSQFPVPSSREASTSSSTHSGIAHPVSNDTQSSSGKRRRPTRYWNLKDAADDPDGPAELKGIYDFFTYTPKPLEMDTKDHTKSAQTRVPQIYDQHLDPTLILKKILYRPEMLTDLCSLAETTVLERWNEGDVPTLESGGSFPTLLLRDTHMELPRNYVMMNEATVVSSYMDTTARFTTVVASTLHFDQSNWDNGLLTFTPQLTGQGQDAIADGYLRVITAPSPDADLSKLPPLSKAIELGGKNMLIWEFKNLLAGNECVMHAIMQLVGKTFPWTFCQYGNRSERCRNEHKPLRNAEGDFRVYKPVVGLDATGPDVARIWSRSMAAVPEQPWTERTDLIISETHRLHAQWILQQIWTQCVKNDVTLAVINAGNCEIFCRRDRLERTLTLSGIIKVPEHKNYGQLQTGLYLAAIRDTEIRLAMTPKNQNDSSEKSRNATGKRQQSTAAKARGAGGQSQNAKVATRKAVQRKPDDDKGSSSHNPKKKRTKSQRVDEKPIARDLKAMDLLFKACHRDELLLDFVRKTKREVTMNTRICEEKVTYYRHQEQEEPYVDSSQVIRVQVSEKFSESVFGGTLLIDNTLFSGFPGFASSVIIKVADDLRSWCKLAKEYDIYRQLEQSPSTSSLVPTVIGLFAKPHARRCHDLYAMVLENVGVDLDPVIAAREEEKWRQLKDPFVQALKAIHAEGVRHGALHRTHHLLVRSTTEEDVEEDPKAQVAFVSFDAEHAGIISNKEEELIIDSILPSDGQAATVPFLPRGRSASPGASVKRQKLAAYDFGPRAWIRAVLQDTSTPVQGS